MEYSNGLEQELGRPAPDGPHCLSDANSVLTAVDCRSHFRLERRINWQDRRPLHRVWSHIQGLPGRTLDVLAFLIPFSVMVMALFMEQPIVPLGVGMTLLGLMLLGLSRRAPEDNSQDVYLYNAAARQLEARRRAGEVSRKDVRRDLKHFEFVMANRRAATTAMTPHMALPRGASGFPQVHLKKRYVVVTHGARSLGIRPTVASTPSSVWVENVTACCGELSILSRGRQVCSNCKEQTLIPTYMWGISPDGWGHNLGDYLGLDVLAIEAIIPEILDHLNKIHGEARKVADSWGWL